MMASESHHDHEIVKDEHGTLRWRPNPSVRLMIDTKINLNDLIILMNELGYGKNSEVYRALYRNMGYSLFRYWEVFYWEANNPQASEYKPT